MDSLNGKLKEMLKQQYLFEIELFCNNVKVFNSALDKFDASLLNRTISFIKTQKW